MTKELYIQQDHNRLGFRRMNVDMKDSVLHKLFTAKTQIFVTSDQKELKILKGRYKDAYKNTTRMCLLGKEETFGLIESILNCPYRITNVRCASMKAKVLVISQDDFFRRISRNNEELVKNYVQKIEFFEERIKNQANVAGVKIDSNYFQSYVNFEDQLSESDITEDSVKSVLPRRSSKVRTAR